MMSQFICTNCHFIGRGKKAGSGLLELIGWISFVLPGMAYRSWRNKHKNSICPKCFERRMIPVETPMGQELAQKYQVAIQTDIPLFNAPSMDRIVKVLGPAIDHPFFIKTKGALKSILAWAFQISVFIAFMLSGLILISEGSMLGIGWIMLAPLALPPVRKFLPTPLGNKLIITAIMVVFFFWATGQMPEIEENNRQQKIAAHNQEITDKAITAFQADPNKVKAEITAMLKEGKYDDARWATKHLVSTNDPEILKLQEKAQTGWEQARKAEKELEAKQREEAQRSQQETQSSEIRALDQCKHEIARFLNADGAGMLPDVKNHGSGNEFVYAWPKGIVQVTTVLGTVNISASCDGDLKPLKVQSLSINGKTIILSGKKVF